MHIAHRLVGHNVGTALRLGIKYALTVGHRCGQRLFDQGMTALLQRHHRLIGVQVVRSGHDDHVGLGLAQELGIIAAGDSLRVQLFQSVQLRLLGVDNARDLSASVGCGDLCHTASGAAASADQKSVLAHSGSVLCIYASEVGML